MAVTMHYNELIFLWINNFANKYIFADHVISYLAYSYLVKFGVFIVILSWLWFSEKNDLNNRKELIIATFAAMLLAFLSAQLIQHIVPHQMRPILDKTITAKIPFDFKYVVTNKNSFPSDHAALFSSLTTGIFLISKPLGYFSIFYLVFLILFPRLYCGLHYPLDIIIGAVLGIFMTNLTCKSTILRQYIHSMIKWFQRT